MGSISIGGAVCPNCGLDRTEGAEIGEDRPPCPRCGEASVLISMEITDIIGPMADAFGVEMVPENQDWSWRDRWDQIQQDLAELTTPRTGAMGAEEIRAARHRLQQFYSSAYHLKDALKRQTTYDVEGAINANAGLAILADLANSEKHDGLDPERRPRSGHEPRVTKVSGSSLPAGGWKAVVVIEHDGKEVDGIQVAESAIDAWSRALAGWGLI